MLGWRIRTFRISPTARLAGLLAIASGLFAQDLVTLQGNRHPLARSEFDVGAAPPEYFMGRMILVLSSSPEQRSALETLLQAQQNPSSPQFHRWLTPDEFTRRFGAAASSVQQAADWLSQNGFTIDELPAGGRSIVFSGTAGQIEAAFRTPIHTYRINGETHHANAADPQIPQALAKFVAGVVSMHDFRRTPMHRALRSAPQDTSGGSHYVAPADFATIYDVAAVYNSGITGSGQAIAIAGRTNIEISDAQTFRSTFQLPANNPTVIVNGANPGIVSTDEETEADLDVEWSGAVAPMAAVTLVVSESTSSTDGIDLSSQYIVSNNLAAVASVSFGSCESQMGSGGRAFYESLWQQAAAQGITVLVSAGDSGAAGCDAPSESTATLGRAVSGLCSTAYSVCAGGTEFNEGTNPGAYWSSSNTSASGSALSYIPEVAWNESGANGGSDLWSTGGGASAYYAKPWWQSGPGVPSDSARDVPDLSLSTALHDGYLIQVLGETYIAGGTSAAAPSLAGILALINQKEGGRQGNINPVLYSLAALADSGGAAVFHGTTGGNNTVPGCAGFSASQHYNQATGVGSPDVFLLLNHWNDTAAPGILTSPAPGSTLSGSTVTFQWTPGTGTSGNYWIRVGTTGVGSYNIFYGEYAGTSATISGVPAGGTIYVRLYSFMDGTQAWVSNDYTYTGSATSFVAAAVSSPAPGSTLTGSTVTFEWTSGTATSGEYWIRVGTTGVGSYNVFAGEFAGTSATIAGLPTTGITVYVRLYSQNAATTAWVSNDYTYTADTSVAPAFVAAVISSPAPGSTLSSASVTFQWTSGTGTSGAYWIRVGTTGVGSYDVFAGEFAATSATITGLPTTGIPVYVRVYSQNAASGTWVSNDYTYTAF
jgi:subtilase family serine protease